mmetsp:Transcript_6437/g.17256  ORF Transcript_6437/g.17256 Transcript_6437/m.17256 type:complete len:204 (-) Transcript_6437:976-1587(-)
MARLWAIALAAALVVAAVASAAADVGEATRKSEVVELSDSEFNALLEAPGTWLVMVHAPWCGHCKRFQPQLLELAELLAPTGVRVGKLDGSRYSSVFNKYGLEGFPSFLLLRHEQEQALPVMRFKGVRSVDNLVAFVKQQQHALPVQTDVSRMMIPVGNKTTERLLLAAAFSFPILVTVMLIVSCVSFLRARSVFNDPTSKRE